mmetsp:Transcript_29664/g.78640  ORF Transcript_29664/g.78640 Transcript_29664/m.78640 type:complete len:537 (+) Transcript_29664:1239-2849(+)
MVRLKGRNAAAGRARSSERVFSTSTARIARRISCNLGCAPRIVARSSTSSASSTRGRMESEPQHTRAKLRATSALLCWSLCFCQTHSSRKISTIAALSPRDCAASSKACAAFSKASAMHRVLRLAECALPRNITHAPVFCDARRSANKWAMARCWMRPNRDRACSAGIKIKGKYDGLGMEFSAGAMVPPELATGKRPTCSRSRRGRSFADCNSLNAHAMTATSQPSVPSSSDSLMTPKTERSTRSSKPSRIGLVMCVSEIGSSWSINCIKTLSNSSVAGRASSPTSPTLTPKLSRTTATSGSDNPGLSSNFTRGSKTCLCPPKENAKAATACTTMAGVTVFSQFSPESNDTKQRKLGTNAEESKRIATVFPSSWSRSCNISRAKERLSSSARNASSIPRELRARCAELASTQLLCRERVRLGMATRQTNSVTLPFKTGTSSRSSTSKTLLAAEHCIDDPSSAAISARSFKCASTSLGHCRCSSTTAVTGADPRDRRSQMKPRRSSSSPNISVAARFPERCHAADTRFHKSLISSAS